MKRVVFPPSLALSALLIAVAPLCARAQTTAPVAAPSSQEIKEALSKVVAAQRRLLLQAKEQGPNGLVQTESQANALSEILAGIETKLPSLIGESSLQGAEDLRTQLQRANRFQSLLEERLFRLDTWNVLPEREATEASTPSLNDTSRSGREEGPILIEVQRARRFLNRFSQSLAVILRRNDRIIRKIDEPPRVFVLRRVLMQVTSGYQQARRVYQSAKGNARKIPFSRRSNRLTQGVRRIDSLWRTVGRDYRIARAQLRKGIDFLSKKISQGGSASRDP